MRLGREDLDYVRYGMMRVRVNQYEKSYRRHCAVLEYLDILQHTQLRAGLSLLRTSFGT